tara:strand:+ start:54 stop:389 length:336 start_codon:yes stop_codon:yes gene_type:complete
MGIRKARKPTKKSTTTNSGARTKKPTTRKTTTRKTTTRKTTTKKTTTKKPTTSNNKSTSVKINPNNYVRISENSNPAKFNEMGQKVQKGLVKWAYYAIDGNVGYHYYLKLK